MENITDRQLKKYSSYSFRKIIKLQENGTLSDDDVKKIIKYAEKHPPSAARKMIRKISREFFSFIKHATFREVWSRISRIILWFCAVGGFLLSLIQFIQDK